MTKRVSGPLQRGLIQALFAGRQRGSEIDDKGRIWSRL
jgi:hypothetical protein